MVDKNYGMVGDNTMVVDGIMITVETGSTGLYSWDAENSTRDVTWSGQTGWAVWMLHGTTFGGAVAADSPGGNNWWGIADVYPESQLKPVRIEFALTDADGNFDTTQDLVSYGHRYLRAAHIAPQQPEFAPYIVNTTDAAGGAYPYQDYTKSIPLAAYDMTDPANPRRLMLGHFENNQAGGMVDGKYWPPTYDVNNISDGVWSA